MLQMSTCAVSRYNFNRSQKTVTVQDFDCDQMRVSGCIFHYKVVLGIGVKAKSVTNNLPILSVLGVRSPSVLLCVRYVVVSQNMELLVGICFC